MITKIAKKAVIDFHKPFHHNIAVNKTCTILGIDIQLFSREELIKTVEEKLRQNKFCHIVTINPEMLVYAEKNKDFKNILKSTLNICDGSGISILGSLLYHQKIPRIPGVELAEIICTIASQQKKSVFFLGGFEVAKKSAQYIKAKIPSLQIAGTFDGDINTLNEVQKTNPDIALVAFGSPKQEYWIQEKGTQIPSLQIGIGVGGTFDFWSGKIKRSPRWMQFLGIEWLYRLCQEPQKRLKRITNAVLIFPSLVIREKIKL